MITFLDLLVVVFMALAAASLLAVCLMFLVRNIKVKKVCFYIVVALGLYACTISFRIFWPFFPMQLALGIVLGAMSIAALVIERLSKGDKKKFTIARIMAAVSLVVGIINAFS